MRIGMALAAAVALTAAPTAAGAQAYEVGYRSVALVAPRHGRADALGLLARIQAACGATGTAVEREPDEDAVELLTRLLSEQVSD